MASTVPAKSQPLHNFALSHLQWNNNHPRQRPRSSSSSSPHHQPQSQSPSRRSQSPMPIQSPMREQLRQSPLRSGGYGGGGDVVSEREGLVKSRGVVEYKKHTKNSLKDGVYGSDHDRKLEKSEKKVSSQLDKINMNNNTNNKESKTKILIKIGAGTSEPPRKSINKAAEEGNHEEQKGEEETDGKIWNLRPRRPIRRSLNESGGAQPRSGGSALHENKPQSQSQQVNLDTGKRIRAEGEASGVEKVKKGKFSIPLLREEIEEDIFIMTGSKPARRPKKRAKNIQKQLDNLFPGLWLSSITPDLYKVPENPTKG